MKVFIAGTSGVLGRAVTRQLLARGHEVWGLVRSTEKEAEVRALGATPVLGSIFDCAFLTEAMEGCDVVMHLATAIPKKSRPNARDWAMNDRLRREGTRNLVEAARARPRRAFIQQSVAFLYGDRRGEWVGEDEPPRPARNLQSALDGERIALAAYEQYELPALVLRGASFYGPEDAQTRATINGIKRRAMPIVSSGDQYWHYVHYEDYAWACVLAAENPAPGEIFFVADDWPFHARDFINYLAAQLRAPAPYHMTVALARLLYGERARRQAQSVRYRTDKIKKMLGWTPAHPTYREGFAEILPKYGVPVA